MLSLVHQARKSRQSAVENRLFFWHTGSDTVARRRYAAFGKQNVQCIGISGSGEFVVNSASQELTEVLRQARNLLARTDNDFSWSSWANGGEALRELDRIIATIEGGILPPRLDIAVLFAPTGPIQEVSLSSGWAREFLALSQQFDAIEQRVYSPQ